jgi:hypothetical protein
VARPDFSREIVVGVVLPALPYSLKFQIRRVYCSQREGRVEVYYSARFDRFKPMPASGAPLRLMRVPGTYWQQIGITKW